MLLQHVPLPARSLISGMLHVDPEKRLKMEQVLADEWLNGLEHCPN